MNLFPRVLCAVLGFGFATQLIAQDPTPRPDAQQQAGRGVLGPFWRAELPGGSFVVALRHILSVSSHQYFVEGSHEVHEVNVSTAGNIRSRFYFIDLNKASGQSDTLDLMSEIAERTAQETGAPEIWKMVVKNYPTTTHAGTVEYRLETKAELDRLFKSVDDAWKNNRDTRYRPKTDEQN